MYYIRAYAINIGLIFTGDQAKRKWFKASRVGKLRCYGEQK